MKSQDQTIPATRRIGVMSQANDTIEDMRTEVEMTVVSPNLLATTRKTQNLLARC
jgi:hypothetical protein